MSAEEIVAAFGVETRPTRIHKKDLIELGTATAADRKLIDAAVDRLDWLATLSPVTIGVAASDDDERPVAAIQLLTINVRTEPVQRLLTIIHRAIPVPAVLVTAYGATCRVSLAPLRRAERTMGVVVERLVTTPVLTQRDAATAAFVRSLAVANLPRTDLAAVYEALIWRVEALTAATVSGGEFRLPADATQAAARRAALAEHDAWQADFARARTAAGREKQLARQVALAEAARVVKMRLDAAKMVLAGGLA